MEEIGKNFYAHELLKLDFSQIHEEGKRQEEIHPNNKGENTIAQGVFNFFSDSVIPKIISEDWIYQAALAFVEEHVQTYFNITRLNGDQTHQWQQNLLKTNNEVVDILARMSLAGKTQQPSEVNFLSKASDFTQLILFEKLTPVEKVVVDDLHQRILDHENMQLTLTLKNIGDMYEVGLSRIMFVARRVRWTPFFDTEKVKIRWNPPFLIVIIVTLFDHQNKPRLVSGKTELDAVFGNYRTQDTFADLFELRGVFCNY